MRASEAREIAKDDPLAQQEIEVIMRQIDICAKRHKFQLDWNIINPATHVILKEWGYTIIQNTPYSVGPGGLKTSHIITW